MSSVMIKPLFALLAISAATLFTGCETTAVVDHRPGYHHSGYASSGYYGRSGRAYRDRGYYDDDYYDDGHHRSRTVNRRNVNVTNINRTNVNRVNVTRRDVNRVNVNSDDRRLAASRYSGANRGDNIRQVKGKKKDFSGEKRGKQKKNKEQRISA